MLSGILWNAVTDPRSTIRHLGKLGLPVHGQARHRPGITGRWTVAA